MEYTTQRFSFKQLFAFLFLSFVAFLVAGTLFAWTGPADTPPAANVPAPINVGTSDQVKDGGLSVNALATFGSQYIQDRLGIGYESPVVALDVDGTVRIGDGGEACQAITAGSVRFNASSGEVEFCDGSDWSALGGVTSTSVQFYECPYTEYSQTACVGQVTTRSSCRYYDGSWVILSCTPIDII